MSNRRDQSITSGIPILLLIIFIEVGFGNGVYVTYLQPYFSTVSMESILIDQFGLNSALVIPIVMVVRSFPLAFFTIIVAAVFYRIRYVKPVNKAKQELETYNEQLLQGRISTYEEWRQYLQEELRRLTNVISRVFLENPNRATQAKRWIKQADQLIADEQRGNLVEAQSIISSINKLILTEEDELREQRNWRNFAIAIMAFYIFILAIVALPISYFSDSQQRIYIFGVPLLVIIWSALGSLAAILYRFYTEVARVRFDVEVRWLIACPIIGIIMGAIAYLTLKSGLIL